MAEPTFLNDDQLHYLRDVLGIQAVVLPQEAANAGTLEAVEPAPSINLRIRGSIATARLFVFWARRGERALSGEAEILAGKMLSAMKLDPHDIYWVEWAPIADEPAPQEAAQIMESTVTRPVLFFGLETGRDFLASRTHSTQKEVGLGDWLELEGSPALTTYAPEELLDSPERKKQAWTHLQTLIKKLTHS